MAKKNNITVIRTSKVMAESFGKCDNVFWYTDVDENDNTLYFLLDNRKGKKDPKKFDSFDGLYDAVVELNKKER